MFAPRPPLEYLAPPTLRKMPTYTGLGAFVTRLKDPENAPTPASEPIEILKPSEIREKKRKRAIVEHEEEVSKKSKLCTLFSAALPHFSSAYGLLNLFVPFHGCTETLSDTNSTSLICALQGILTMTLRSPTKLTTRFSYQDW